MVNLPKPKRRERKIKPAKHKNYQKSGKEAKIRQNEQNRIVTAAYGRSGGPVCNGSLLGTVPPASLH